MRKFLVSVLLMGACMVLLPPKGHAVPIDVPYQVVVDSTANTGTMVISTNAFVATPVATSQWCISHLAVVANAATAFTMYWSASTVSAGTTDYMVQLPANTVYDSQWSTRNPYCSPIGQNVLTLKSSVAISTITVEGYLFKGWTP